MDVYSSQYIFLPTASHLKTINSHRDSFLGVLQALESTAGFHFSDTFLS